jgi:hypothetical protein
MCLYSKVLPFDAGSKGVCTVMSHAISVLSVKTRKVLVSPCACTKPVSSAKGTTPANILPQLGVVSTVSLSGCNWANREIDVHAGLGALAHDRHFAGEWMRPT